MDEIVVPLAGEQAALHASFESFYDGSYRQAVSLAAVLTGSRSRAEEIAQEAFLAAYQDWARVLGYEDPGAWLRRVVANKAASHVRHLGVQRRKLRLLATEEAKPDPYESAVWRAVRELPTRQAQAIALHYLEDLPVSEIAAVLDCSESAVKTHLGRARRSLASKLGERGEGS